MTTLELQPKTKQEAISPYFIDIESAEARFVAKDLVQNNEPFASAEQFPDLGTKRIYMVSGNDIGSDAGRIIEADVLENDKRWMQSRGETEKDNNAFEDNSIFYILVDGDNANPELVGSLRIADCGKGPSETEQFYRASYADSELPEELKMKNGRDGVWDIVYATVRSKYQDGLNASWLYFAMHKHSKESEVKKWVSNISDIEHKMLDILGIPFKKMMNVEKVTVTNPVNGKRQRFGFYHAEAPRVADAVEAKTRELEDNDALQLAVYGLISRFGSFSRPEDKKIRLAS
jgi:hypothetical protein